MKGRRFQDVDPIQENEAWMLLDIFAKNSSLGMLNGNDAG